MEAGAIIGISITVILISALVMERFRLPMVIGVLIAGAMIGPSSPIKGLSFGGFDFDSIIIGDATLVNAFALLGSALILFGIGLEYSIMKIYELGIGTFLAAIIKVGIIFIFGYAGGEMLGFGQPAAILFGFLLSFSSTPIVIKILEGHGKIHRPEVPFIIAVLILEDLIAVFLLGIMATSGISDPNTMAFALFKVILTFVFAYLLLSRVLAWLLSFVMHSDELLVLFVVSAVLAIGYLSGTIGLGFSVGAFLAGSTIAGTEAARRVEEIIRPFNAVFSSFFFFSIGMLVNFGETFPNFTVLAVMVLVAALVKFLASAVAAYLSGLSGRSASFAAAGLLPLGELSLVIGAGAAASGILPISIVGMLASVIVFTSLLSVVVIGSEGRVYKLAEGSMPGVVTRHLRLARSTSIGMQRVVRENSRYSRVIEKLPTIGGTNWPLSSHEQLAQALRNSVAYFFGMIILFLMMWMAGKSGMPEGLGDYLPFTTVGFFAVATLFLTNSAQALGTYIGILRRSGKMSFTIAMQLVALVYFFGAMALACLAAISLANPLYFVLLLPCIGMAAAFASDIVREGKLISFRWRL